MSEITPFRHLEQAQGDKVRKQKDVQLAAKKEYDFAFECELAGMTVAEFIRWNPTIDEAEAEVFIAAAKAKVARRVARSGKKLKLKLDEEPGGSRS